VVDVAARKLRLVYKSDKGSGGLTSLSDDAKLAVRTAEDSRGDNNLFLVDIATGNRTLLTPHTPPARFFGVIAPDGKAVYLNSNDGRDLAAFSRIRLGKGGPGAIEVLAERADGELEGFTLNHAGTVAALTWNVAGFSTAPTTPTYRWSRPSRSSRTRRSGACQWSTFYFPTKGTAGENPRTASVRRSR
jgi:hypothetical protein